MSDHNCYAIIPRSVSDPVFPVKRDANPGGGGRRQHTILPKFPKKKTLHEIVKIRSATADESFLTAVRGFGDITLSGRARHAHVLLSSVCVIP